MVKRLFAVLRRPIFFVVVNFFLVNTLFSLLPHNTGNIIYNLGRIGIVFYAGRLVAKKLGGRWWPAAAGVVLYFIDHVVIKGGIFLLNYLLKPEGAGLSAFGGVLASFIIFIPLAMLIGMIGGMTASGRSERTPE